MKTILIAAAVLAVAALSSPTFAFADDADDAVPNGGMVGTFDPGFVTGKRSVSVCVNDGRGGCQGAQVELPNIGKPLRKLRVLIGHIKHPDRDPRAVAGTVGVHP